MKGWRAIALALVALAAVGVVAASAGAAGPSTLPQGFRYAAEIQAKVNYDGTYSIAQTGYQRCPSGEGETKVHTSEKTTLHIDRTATFSHITVPVATEAELGKAVSRLGLEATITTPGKITQDYSTLEVNDSLVVPNPEGEGCQTEAVVCAWDLHPVPGSGIEEITAHDFGDVVTGWNINLLGVNRPTGEPCPVGDGTSALSAALADSRKLYPDGLSNFPEVVISRALGNDFHRLLKHTRLTLTPVIEIPGGEATSNCATHLNEEEETCAHSVTGRASVELHRLFFYKTKQAYPR